MFRIIKKSEVSTFRAVMAQLVSILVSLVAVALIVWAMGYNPFEFYRHLIGGSFSSMFRFTTMVKKAIPLIILSLGTLVAFKMKFWNIGAEGQMLMGAFGASFVALYMWHLPPQILIPLMFLAGILGGALCALIPALLKVKFGTNETLVTLMLNYIALGFVTYLQYGPWRADGRNPKIATFSTNAQLPTIGGVHIGWIIAIVLVVFITILISRTKFGYEMSVLGESPATAKYAGINVKRTIVLAVMLSGALCGTAGVIQASAIEKTLNDQITGNLGFTAVITTYLARLSPPAVVLTSVFYAIFLVSGKYLATKMKMPQTFVDALPAIVIFFVLGGEFFLNYKIVRRAKSGGAK